MESTTVTSKHSPAGLSRWDRPLPALAKRLLKFPLFDALAAPHGVSRYLELIHPLWSLEEERAIVVDVQRETADVRTLTLRPAGSRPAFRAGQFVNLTVDVEGVRLTRCYSISCSEHRGDDLLQITVKAHPDGKVSEWLHEHAEPGLVVGLTRAMGDFTLPSARPEHVVLVSGGSGITPTMSILRTLCDEGHAGRVTFLSYARSRSELIFGDELETIAARHRNVRLVTPFTRQAPGPFSAGLGGRFEAAHLAAVAPDYAEAEAYVCGPGGLIDAVRDVFEAADAGDHLHVERFEPAPRSAAHAGTVTGRVRFAASDVTKSNDGRTLLEQAEAAGLSPEHGCRMGICHSCTCRLESGRVRNVNTGQLSSEAGTRIQLCVNAPLGDVTVEL